MLIGEVMYSGYLVRVDSVEGTEAHNVARTVAYAALQLGLHVQSSKSDRQWSTFSAWITGESREVARLVGLLELAFPNAIVGIEAGPQIVEKAPK
ncbi:MAG: hypothetical protein WD273_07580 [Trueperaceae bacterium]